MLTANIPLGALSSHVFPGGVLQVALCTLRCRLRPPAHNERMFNEHMLGSVHHFQMDISSVSLLTLTQL